MKRNIVREVVRKAVKAKDNKRIPQPVVPVKSKDKKGRELTRR